jgi:hypothetical protein
MKRLVATWSIVATMLLLACTQPTAYGLEFPMTTRLEFTEPISASLVVQEEAAMSEVVAPVISELALVAKLAAMTEAARKPTGAKKVAKTIMKDDYGWSTKQYTCLNHLWTRESHWNYQAHNYRSGAHGIAQALPATKMEVIGTDWRTNPVTQIRWGLKYIAQRYETPCKAYAKFKRSRYY